MGIDIQNATLAFIVKFVAIYFVYQVMLFVVGTLMGEHKFVKWFLIKMNSRLINRKTTSKPPVAWIKEIEKIEEIGKIGEIGEIGKIQKIL